MSKKYFIKMFLLISLPLFTCSYLDNRIGFIPSTIAGFVLLIVLSLLLFSRKEKV
ncbi:hypothetical protein ABE042_08095 [Viridibacillus arvi]|jgi:hypothetical protein|uniref:DUF3309 family protein n=1 Tax=Viridibacillus arvi TaxID=263475 RepID=UPI0012ED9B25|nr:DUF3309 family protein [Viridibacillus arvi]